MRSRTFYSPLEDCDYLPGRTRRLRYELNPDITKHDYQEQLNAGWRRFGPVLFRPACPSCGMCQSLRVPIDTFRPSESQRRAWRKNRTDVTLRIGTPSATQELADLFVRFHRHKQATVGWPQDDQDEKLYVMTHNPFPTEEWSYYLGARLVGVGWVDVLSEGMSAIYFVHEPDEHRRSLGTFNILMMIEAARKRGLPHVYLGYYVEGCRSLEYKSNFRPHEILRAGRWCSEGVSPEGNYDGEDVVDGRQPSQRSTGSLG